jgi:hypothetical protein
VITFPKSKKPSLAPEFLLSIDPLKVQIKKGCPTANALNVLLSAARQKTTGQPIKKGII